MQMQQIPNPTNYYHEYRSKIGKNTNLEGPFRKRKQIRSKPLLANT